MEDAIDYSLEVGRFDKLAILRVTTHYIDQLVQSNKTNHALSLVRKVVDVRVKRLGLLNQNTVAVYHLLPALLNQTKSY